MNSTYGTIYKIINKVNGKVYIGVRAKVFNKVQYNINSFLSGTSNKKLKEDVEKYGKTAFELITDIDTCNRHYYNANYKKPFFNTSLHVTSPLSIFVQ